MDDEVESFPLVVGEVARSGRIGVLQLVPRAVISSALAIPPSRAAGA